jgi:hypothetical protein
MKLFKLRRVGENTTWQECSVVLEPACLYDSLLELFADFSTDKLNKEEMSHYRYLKKAVKQFEGMLFCGLSMEDKCEIADAMTDYTDRLKNELVLLDQTFQRSMMNRYDTDVRLLICKLYTISTVAQSVLHYILHLRKAQEGCVLTDYLRTITYRCYRIQNSLDERFGKDGSLYDPNSNKDIEISVKCFINKIFINDSR